jgi:hypothetical protein
MKNYAGLLGGDDKMMNYILISRKPKIFRSFTGLGIEEFDRLYQMIEAKYEEYEKKRLSREGRKKAIGQGRKFKLDLIDRLLMLLVYYRLYITYTLAGFLFNLDQSNVYRNIKHLEPLVKECIPLPKKVYQATRRIKDIEELLEYFPDMKAFLDATEQEIPRPKNKRRRKSYYSGKKKKHTVRTQIITNKDGLIIHITGHVHGRKHDYDLFKDKRPPPPKGVEITADLGYQGIEKDFPSLKTRIPVKRKRGKTLEKKDKRYNKELSRSRVVVEHTIGKMKKFKIMGSKFRNKLGRYDDMTSIVSGLTNLKVMASSGFDLDKFTA